MSRSEDHSPKKEIRWDSVGSAGWRNDKQVTFTEDHKKALLEICNNLDFVTAVNRVAGQYMSREKPKQPLSDRAARYQPNYKKRHIQPTLGDMEKTLLDLQKTDNKAKLLNKTPKGHPIWGVMKRAWYKEHKVQLNRDVFDRIHEVAKFQYMLETTPNDHPQWQAMQDVWDKEHQTDFEKMNTEVIPNIVKISLNIVKISLKHLKEHPEEHPEEVYSPEQTDSRTHKIWLAWRLGLVLQRFGLKAASSKDGDLANCLRIALDAAGVLNKYNKPIETTDKYITKEVLKELKKTPS